MANFVCGKLGVVFATGEGNVDFRQLFLVPAAVAVAAALILLVFFHPPAKAKEALKDVEPMEDAAPTP